MYVCMWAKHAINFTVECKNTEPEYFSRTVTILWTTQPGFDSRSGAWERGWERKVVIVRVRKETLLPSYRATTCAQRSAMGNTNNNNNNNNNNNCCRRRHYRVPTFS